MYIEATDTQPEVLIEQPLQGNVIDRQMGRNVGKEFNFPVGFDSPTFLVSCIAGARAGISIRELFHIAANRRHLGIVPNHHAVAISRSPFLTLLPTVPTVDTVVVVKACKLPKFMVGGLHFGSVRFRLVVGWEVLLNG